MAEEHWEHGVIERLASEGLREMRRARRWGIFFKLLTLVLLFSILLVVVGTLSESTRSCRQVHRAGRHARRARSPTGRTNAENVMAGLQAAFKNKGTQGVVLRINSPGGSPVQAGMINDEIRRLRSDLSQHAAVRRGRGNVRVGRVLRRGCGRQDLRRQGEPHRLDRRDHRRLRLRRRDGQARRRAPRDHRRREQGVSRSVLAADARRSATTRRR